MILRWLFASFHLIALGVGLGAVWARARALRGTLDPAGVRRVLHADAWWGVAALLWLVTGLVRLFAGMEKATDYYLHNHVFWAKMGLFILVIVLEIAPMVTLIRWRASLRRGEEPDTRNAGRFARISYIQAGLIAWIVLVAAAMARGVGG